MLNQKIRVKEEALLKERVQWSEDEDTILLQKYQLYGPNWHLLADIINSSVRICGRFRVAEECCDRIQTVLPQKGPDSVALALKRKQKEKERKMKENKEAKEAGKPVQPVGFGSEDVFQQIFRAMKEINTQRQQCKGALRASLSQADDAMSKAIMQVPHNSHKKALTDAQARLGAPPQVIGKTLMPGEIVELRMRKMQAEEKQRGVRRSNCIISLQFASQMFP